MPDFCAFLLLVLDARFKFTIHFGSRPSCQPNVSGQAAFTLLKLAVPKLKPIGVTKLTPAGLPVMENVCEKDLGEFFGAGADVTDEDGCACAMIHLIQIFLATSRKS